MQQLLDDLRRRQRHHRLHRRRYTIVGAGGTQGSLDTANILKPALARGELQVISDDARRVPREHRERRGTRAPFPRRWSSSRPRPHRRSDILRNIAPHYEALPQRPLHPKRVPLRACVTLDRAVCPRPQLSPTRPSTPWTRPGARVRILAAQEPESIRETERQIKRGGARAAQAVSALTTKASSGTAPRALAQDAPQRAARLMAPRPAERPGNSRRSRGAAGDNHHDGHPRHKHLERRAERLRSLSEHLQERVIGQRDAVERVARSLRRSPCRLKTEADRPIGGIPLHGTHGRGQNAAGKGVVEMAFRRPPLAYPYRHVRSTARNTTWRAS